MTINWVTVVTAPSDIKYMRLLTENVHLLICFHTCCNKTFVFPHMTLHLIHPIEPFTVGVIFKIQVILLLAQA